MGKAVVLRLQLALNVHVDMRWGPLVLYLYQPGIMSTGGSTGVLPPLRIAIVSRRHELPVVIVKHFHTSDAVVSDALPRGRPRLARSHALRGRDERLPAGSQPLQKGDAK